MLSLQEVWNERNRKQLEPVEPRSYIRSSELGKAYIDRFLRMNGVPYSNQFDHRTLRIFDAGKTFEWIVLRVFAMAGLLKDRQVEVILAEGEDNLEVRGHIDGIIGGIMNWHEARNNIHKWLKAYKLDETDEIIEQISLNLIDGLEEKYGKRSMPEHIIEIKSINSRAFWSHRNRDENDQFIGYDHHKLQLLSYMIALDKPGTLIYVSKDDLCIQEVPVFRTQALEDMFWNDVKIMTNFMRNNVEPLKPDEIVFNKKKNHFELNWEVGRSLYLKYLYNYKDQEDFRLKLHQRLLDINRAWRHYLADKMKPEDLFYKNKYKFTELNANPKVPA